MKQELIRTNEFAWSRSQKIVDIFVECVSFVCVVCRPKVCVFVCEEDTTNRKRKSMEWHSLYNRSECCVCLCVCCVQLKDQPVKKPCRAVSVVIWLTDLIRTEHRVLYFRCVCVCVCICTRAFDKQTKMPWPREQCRKLGWNARVYIALLAHSYTINRRRISPPLPWP